MSRAVLVLALLGGCVQSGEVTCSDGRLCPPGYQCDETNMRCLSAEQVAACSGRDEGADCTVSGAPGACRVGACEALVCGDGLRSLGEACDGADLGGATCKDAGYYDEAGLACSEFCTFDVNACSGFCGDNMINGLELCDGAPPPGSCVDYGFDAGPVTCGGSCGISFGSCARFGWVPEATTLMYALAFDALSPSDIWVGGDSGMGPAIARFDGNAWSVQPLTGTAPVHAIAAAGPDDAWMIRGSSAPTLEHFVSGQWTTVQGVPAAIYRDLWASGPSAVFVATADAGVLAWNGSSWQTLGTLADPATSIEGTGPTDLWVVTDSGAVQHWNGTTWQPVAVDIVVQTLEVTAPDDVWVVGPSTIQTDAYATAHWNGSQWTIMLDPGVNPQIGQRLFAIGASGANDVWISSSGGQARHFDGTNWGPAGNVVVGSGPFSDMRTFAGTTLAFTFDGYFYRYRGQMYARFNTGATNRLLASTSPTPATTVAIDNKNSAYVFDGKAWTPQTIDPAQPADTNRSMWARTADDIWVGRTGGRLFHYDGASWVDTSLPQSIIIDDIVGFAADDVWMFGQVAVHYDGATFDSTSLTGNTVLLRASGSGPADIWALGSAVNGTNIYRYNGSTWTTSSLADKLTDILAFAPDNVLATGLNRIWHWNGTAWSSQLMPVLDKFIALAATGPTDVFAFTQNQLIHFDGERWSFIHLPSDPGVVTHALSGITALPGQVDLLYDTGTGPIPIRRLIRTRPWSCAATETSCSDGVDNDCDVHVDGLDSDCP